MDVDSGSLDEIIGENLDKSNKVLRRRALTAAAKQTASPLSEAEAVYEADQRSQDETNVFD